MNIETVLVAVDGSERATKAVEYAVGFAERYGADLHALYVFGEGAVRGVEAGDVTPPDLAAESERFMDDIRDIAGDLEVCHSSAYGFSMSDLSRHPGSVVLDAADEVGADFIVLPRKPVPADPNGLTSDADGVLQKAAGYVIAYASLPVLSV